jgi:hypothetical protein
MSGTRIAGATAARSRREPIDQEAGVPWPEPDEEVSVFALSGLLSRVQYPRTGVRGGPCAPGATLVPRGRQPGEPAVDVAGAHARRHGLTDGRAIADLARRLGL